MKILFTNFHRRNGGGHVAYVVNLLKGLSAEHECWVATPKGSRLFQQAAAVPDVRVIDQQFSSRLGRMWSEVRQLRRLLRSEKFDLVHVNASADHRHVMLASLGLRHRPRILLTKHNSHRLNTIGHAMRARWATDGVIAVSAYIRKMLDASCYASKPLYTIGHGIDTAFFSPVPADRKIDWSEALLPGLVRDGICVLSSVGGTDYEKGWLDLVEAVSLFPADQRDQFRIIVAGDMPGPEKVQKVRQLGMQDYVVFPGLLEDVRPVLEAADIGFVLSHHEALSFACRESMAMGLPVLVSDAGGLPENVSHGSNGWIVPCRDPVAIRDVLVNVLEHRAAIVDMGRQARLRAEQEFSLQVFSENTFKAYSQIVSLISKK
ncbi:MAG: glycosyltransferase [Corticimicrobacter sp.]|uniref:glycosyltransferase n=1 Tax=Corticimicrobacter sp. TaxID=2678536 RepID=UPI0032DA1418